MIKSKVIKTGLLITAITVIAMTSFFISRQENVSEDVSASQETLVIETNDNLQSTEENESTTAVNILSGMDSEVPAEEQKYIDEVLSKITKDSSKEDVIELLGTPSRDSGLKVNWWVTINGQESRVGVYFSLSGNANRINLDGGPGRFYYRTDLD